MIDCHWRTILDSQEKLSKVNPTNKDDAIIQAFKEIQNQDLIMEKFATFGKSERAKGQNVRATTNDDQN
jgi:hypothetical protein